MEKTMEKSNAIKDQMPFGVIPNKKQKGYIELKGDEIVEDGIRVAKDHLPQSRRQKWRPVALILIVGLMCWGLLELQRQKYRLEEKISMLQSSLREKQNYIGSLIASKKQVTDYCVKKKMGRNSNYSMQLYGRYLTIAERIQFPVNVQLIGPVLYQHEELVQNRQRYHNYRTILYNRFTDYFPELRLGKYTLRTESINRSEQKLVLAEDYLRLDKKYNISIYNEELPMCVIMSGYNNNNNFRIEYALNSVFLQNYSNYHAIIIDDFSNDGSQEIYRRYFDFYDIEESIAKLILNEKRKTSLQNQLNAIFDHCRKDEIGVSIDGDDQYLGRNVLKLFNTFYHKQQYGFLYSRYLKVFRNFIETDLVRREYSQQVKDYQLYREADQNTFFSQIRTWRIALFYEVDLDDLKDLKGNYFTITYDRAMFYPIAELSCGNIDMINQFNYLYNVDTGLNDDLINRKYQIFVDRIVRSRRRYPCSKIYGGYKNRAEKKLMESQKELAKTET